MPTRNELVRALAVDGIGGYSLVTLGKQADAVLALLAAEPGVAVPEPDEQRCPHGETEAHSWPKPLGRAYCPGPDKRCADCLGSGQTMEHFGAGGWADMREVDCETCDGTGHVPGPAASPVAQEDQP